MFSHNADLEIREYHILGIVMASRISHYHPHNPVSSLPTLGKYGGRGQVGPRVVYVLPKCEH